MRRWMVAAVAAIVMALAGVAEAQVVNLLTCTVQSSLNPIAPGATCTYGGIRHTCQPIAGGATDTDYCFPGNTGPQGPQGPTGATGPAGQDASGVRWLDASDVLVDDVYAFVSQSFGVIPAYWTGDTFWPLYHDGSSRLDFAYATLIYYTNSACTGTPVIGMDGGRQNEVFGAYTSVAQVSLEQFDAYRPGAPASPSNCWYKNASNVCTALASCYWTKMAEALPAGSAPDLSAYDLPLREAAAP